MKDRLRVGLIGLGRLNRHYVEYFARIWNAKLIAVADIDEAALKSVAADFDVPHLYADYHDLMRTKIWTPWLSRYRPACIEKLSWNLQRLARPSFVKNH